MDYPNVIILFPDQLRAQALGYMGDPNVKTPQLDSLSHQSLIFSHAVATCPVCSPSRASLLTGQFPLTHGVFLNDVYLKDNPQSMGNLFSTAGYDTIYIGKWHLDGHGDRHGVIPQDRRQGFSTWKVLECTHEYNNSTYYDNENEQLTQWGGYDALDQTKSAIKFICEHDSNTPYLMMLSWGPPHEPYNNAPRQFQQLYSVSNIKLRPNVPLRDRAKARKDLAGYYAHISALDDCIGQITQTLHESGQEENTILIFWSDHGDMLYSQGQTKKQRPWDESILVPLLLRYPKLFGQTSRQVGFPINTEDILPTLLGLCQIPQPSLIEGHDWAQIIQDPAVCESNDNQALIASYWPFADWNKRRGGNEFRGIRTKRYTYARTLKGPWLLYDNQIDPYQRRNLCNRKSHAVIQTQLDRLLFEKLASLKDEFLAGEHYLNRFGYVVDKWGAAPYKN